MFASDVSLPVSVDPSLSEVTEGITGFEGTIRHSGEALYFEYRTKGWRRTSDLEVVTIPLDALREVVLKRWLKGGKLVLRPRRRAPMEKLPGERQDDFVFKVKSEDMELAGLLVEHLEGLVAVGGSPSIPFQLPDIGVEEVNGLLYIEDNLLVFEVGMGLSGVYKDDDEIIKIEPGALEEMSIEEGMVRDRLLIWPKTDELLEAMPGTFEKKLKMKTPKKYRPDVEQLIEEVRRIKRSQRDG